MCLVLGKDTNPSAETIGRGGCFVLESLVLFYDKLYLKAFNEKKKICLCIHLIPSVSDEWSAAVQGPGFHY